MPVDGLLSASIGPLIRPFSSVLILRCVRFARQGAGSISRVDLFSVFGLSTCALPVNATGTYSITFSVANRFVWCSVCCGVAVKKH